MDTDRHQELLAIVRKSLPEKAAKYAHDPDLAAATIGELDLDSLEKLQLVLDLETEVSAMANETEVAACRTVGDLVALIARSPTGRK